MCHFNSEGISKSKCEVLSNVVNKVMVDVIALQETHTAVDDEDIRKRGFIQVYLILGAIHHKQYGVATNIKKILIHAKFLSKITKMTTSKYWLYIFIFFL